MNSTVGTGVATNTLELDAESHMLRDAVLYGLETGQKRVHIVIVITVSLCRTKQEAGQG